MDARDAQWFWNPYNCGARTLESTPYGFAVGTVNPFGPTVAVKRNGGWTYTANRRGGVEVWLGAPQLPRSDSNAHRPFAHDAVQDICGPRRGD